METRSTDVTYRPQAEHSYRVTTTYDQVVIVRASSRDDAAIAGESRAVRLLRQGAARFAPSRVRAIRVELLAA